MNDLFVEGAKADAGLKIVRLEAENIKRLSAVEIKPDGNMVEITGRNAQGKSSILDAIWWAMKGRGVIQSTPIRRGAEEAHVELDLGKMVVRRRFKLNKEGNDFTTDVRVEAVDGARYPTPQALLDSLMGDLCVDPLQFLRMDQKQQFNLLRTFVPDVDFEAIDQANREDYANRTVANRTAKQHRSAADQIAVPADLPDEPIDEAALTEQLARAGEHNGQIETRKAARAAAAEKIERAIAQAQALKDGLPAKTRAIEARRTATVEDIERQIEALQKRIAKVNADADAELTDARDLTAEECQSLDTEAAVLRSKLDAAPPLPDPIDVAALTSEIAQARQINERIRQRAVRDKHVAAAEDLETLSQALTKGMAERDARKAAAIASANLPVAGIEFGDGELLLNGLPLDQASDAEQLRASVAIAMALSPRLRVIRVRDGNVLDADGMKLLAELAQQYDAQVWIETVRSDDRVAFVIEDGRVKRGEAA